MKPQAGKRLGEILAAKGYVSEEQIVQLLARSAHSGKRIGEVLRDALEEQRKARQQG